MITNLVKLASKNLKKEKLIDLNPNKNKKKNHVQYRFLKLLHEIIVLPTCKKITISLLYCDSYFTFMFKSLS